LFYINTFAYTRTEAIKAINQQKNPSMKVKKVLIIPTNTETLKNWIKAHE